MIRIATVGPLLGACMLATAFAAEPGPATAGTEAQGATESAAVEVGAEAPDFELAATDGTTHRLSELRGEKNAVLIFFRGVW